MRTQSLPSFKLPPLSLLISLLFPAAPVVAGTHLLEAAYIEQWSDWKVTKGKDQIEIHRIYSSRSIHRGLFGFGWCSSIEKTISVDADIPDLQSCNPITDLAPIEWRKTEDFYEAQYKDRIEIYDRRSGKLQSIVAGQLKVKLKYDSRGRPTQLCDHAQCFDVHYMPQTDFISKISANGLRPNIYNYQNDDLIFASTSTNQTFYTYDHFHNLTEVKENESRLRLRYNDADDQITSLERGPVRETYEYNTIDQKTKRIQTTKVVQYLGDRKVYEQTYVFHFDRDTQTNAFVLRTIQTKEPR